MSDVEDSPRSSPQLDRTSVISRKAKAVIAGVTALLTLATGVLTLKLVSSRALPAPGCGAA
ncbi:MAG TPA: hypothetical protein VFB44_00340 [Thermoleophilaceae bacterium]|nr:hypothetical protein [Thermoleophilaceae bacterium]